MSIQKKTVIYPLCKIYKGDVISYDTSVNTRNREIVSGKDGGVIKYKKHGKGIFTKRGDFYYVGDFRDDVRHGKGEIIYNDNSRYSGDWLNDRPYGTGEIFWADGTEYIGEVKGAPANPTTELAVADGKGSLTHPNGSTQVGVFHINRQISGERWYSRTNDTFDGTYTDDMNNSYEKGRLDIFNYYVYSGSFKGNAFNGKGRLEYRNKDTYTGLFKDGFFHGNGVFYDAVNKIEYTGQWKNGNMLPNQKIRRRLLGRSRDSYSEKENINLDKLREEANKNPSSKLFRPAPDTLFQTGRNILDYVTAIPQKIADLKSIQKGKPVAYFTIRAHGGYSHGETKKAIKHDMTSLKSMIEEYQSDAVASGIKIDEEWLQRKTQELAAIQKRYDKLRGENPYEGEQDTFIVPEGVRLVFLNQSLTTIPIDTDKFLFKPEFYTNSLTDRNNYQSISPISLFSTIKHSPSGSPSKIDICKFLNHRVLPSKFTTNYMNWKIQSREQIREHLDFFHYTSSPPFDEIKTSLESCSNSIYDSGMECSNLQLTWTPSIGSEDIDKKRVKIGIYPLPSDSLIKEAQSPKTTVTGMETAFERFKRFKSFAGGFMPTDPTMTDDDDQEGRIDYTSNPMEMWHIYGEKMSELKDFVQLLPRGTREHPCVYFMNTCRNVLSDSSASNIDPEVGRSLRAHSDTVQEAYDKM